MRTSRRGDVGPRKRRRWSTEQKKAVVAEIDAGGSTLEVARQHGVRVNVLFRWRRELFSATSAPSGDAANPRDRRSRMSCTVAIPISTRMSAARRSGTSMRGGRSLLLRDLGQGNAPGSGLTIMNLIYIC